ncbi:hypothetical protein RhiirC2_751761 [Rhizophagus irregularis]|uniref:Uncharacterized protein n=1 Tax=Rhizophagus irregularis TaxID=588596 RepID=A0A2N1N0K5_9GLOM|nr:hypothetical protein RhiirC2_751761 [Rhizophagus irregularis]
MAAYFDFTENKEKELENSCKVRVYARTAVNSCVITGMVICALRSKERKDVVFAKETVLELLEITPEGALVSIFEQPVFGTIKDIKVLHSRFPQSMIYDPIDDCVQLKNEDYFDNQNVKRVIPGQDVLVCLSDSGMLSFLAYTEYYNDIDNSGGENVRRNKGKGKVIPEIIGSNVESSRKSGRFQVIKEIVLSMPGLDYQKSRSKLCIDPTGRLIAVAAWQNTFQLFSVYRGAKLTFDPINTKEYQQDGVIWHMTFLYPMDDMRILLAMIIYNEKEKQPMIVIYQFWAADSPERDVINYYSLQLDKDSSLPLHIIPLPNYPESLLYVTETEMCFIQTQNVIAGHNEFYKVPLPVKGKALMTSYAYPMDASILKRSSLIESHPKQYVYAGIEDGTLYRIEIIDEKNIIFSLIQKENGLNCIGECMSVLCVEEESGEEFIIVGGDMSDGAVVKVSQMKEAEITSVIPNWAPILDFQMLDFHQERHDVIFACSGRGKYGSIRELRRAIGVNVMTRTDAEFGGVTSLWGLKYSSEDLIDSFLALSFANSTRLMFIRGGELDDISENSGFDLEVCSLCISNICDTTGVKGVLTQVHRNAVIVSEPRIDKISLLEEGVFKTIRWIPPENSIIEVASAYENIIVISLLNINGSIITVLRVDIDYEKKQIEIIKIAESLLDSQPCFIKCISPSSLVPIPMCMIGTFKPCIKFISLNMNNLLQTLHEEVLVDYSITKVNIPESACIIGNNEKAYFLAGLREGTIVYFQWSWSSDDKPMLSRPIVRRIGTFPVKFITPQPYSNIESNITVVLALSDRPWQIEHNQHTGLNFACVAFEHYEHVQEAAVFNYDETIKQSYMFISKNCLNFVQLNNFIKNNIKTIDVYDTPRRLYYDGHNKLFIVACTSSQLPFPTSILKLIDPSSGEIKHEYNLSVHTEFSDNREAVYSITGWKYSTIRQEFRFICIGTGIHCPPDNDINQGRFMIFNIKKSNHEYGIAYELNKIKEKSLNGIVHAICPLIDKYILVGEGRTLNVLKFNLEENKLTKMISRELRWPILSINSSGNKICVGTQKGLSFFEFEVEKERINFLKMEKHARLIGDSIMLNENLVIGADKCGNVFGLLYDKEDQTIVPCLRPLFSFYEGEIVSKLRIGNLGYRTENSYNNNNCDDDDTSASSITVESNLNKENREHREENNDNNANNEKELGWDINKDLKNSAAVIVGCSLLGSVFLFMRIELKAFRLLSVLQNVLEKWPTTKPCLGNDNPKFRLSNHVAFNSSSNSLYRPTNLIIDGEMVSQFLRLTKFEQLKIVESNFEIMKIGKEYLLGEDIDEGKFLDDSIEILEDDDVIMIHHHDDEDYEMSIEDDDVHSVKRESFGDSDVKGKIAGKGGKQVSPKEIVDVLNFILSELNMQVS